MAEEKEKTKEEVKEYQLVEVPTGSQLAFRTPEGNVVTQEELLVELANKVDKIAKEL